MTIAVYQDNDLPTPQPSALVNSKKTNKEMTPGRTPLGKRTSNSNSSSTATTPTGKPTGSLSNFRRSLVSPKSKTTTTTVEKSPKDGAAAVPKEDTVTQTVGRSSKKSVTFFQKSKCASQTAVDHHENPVEAAAAAEASSSYTSSSITESTAAAPVSSLRKSLRATLSPGLQKAHTAHRLRRGTPAARMIRTTAVPKAHTTYSTTSSKAPPQTPNSMLKDELEYADADESLLLLSPAPVRQRPAPAAAVVHRPMAPPQLQQQISKPTVPAATKMNSARTILESTSRTRLLPAANDDASTTSTTATTVRHRRPQGVDSTARSSWSRVMPSVVAGTLAPSTTMRTVSAAQANTVTTTGTTASTPFTSRGNGVCMDLSGIFFNAASTARKPAQRPRLPRSTHKSARKPLAPRVSERQSPFHHDASDSVVTVQDETEDDWAEKQCETFSNWLNYTFQPSEDSDHQVTLGNGRTQDHVGLRMLVLHQRMAQARTKGLEIYHSADMVQVRRVVSSEIARGRLLIRKDRDMYADLTLRNQICALLLSYSTPWLRLGLETLFGESILPEAPHETSPPRVAGNAPVTARKVRKSEKTPMSPMTLALKQFIVQRVLSDDATLAKYTKGRCKVPSGNFEKKYLAEMRVLVLQRLLVLFFFLDQARKKHVLEKTPRLFTKNAKVKSTRQVLLEFSRLFLSAEGDFVKHLARVGLKVYYKQEPVDELDFTITNLAVDLRDGVRLAKMTEILTGAPPKSVLVSLRLPAVSRLQKLHNVGLVIKTLCDFGVPLSTDIASHHIVDGHREMVLKLMWSTVAHCCLKELLDVDKVEAEIQRILHCSAAARHGMGDGSLLQSLPSDSDSSSDYEESELKSLLLRWSQAVCICFGLHVNDLTNDFADGKASCLLIHYYHPNVLRLEEIHSTSGNLSRDGYISDKGLEKERANAVLANNRISELGGIPKMIPMCDTLNVPDEKSMLLCLSFMCSRLIESGIEIRSCVLIQQRYRKYRNVILQQKQRVAARVILVAWRENKVSYYQAQRLKYGKAVNVIQDFILSNRKQLKSLEKQRLARQLFVGAAIVVQKHVRGYIAKLTFTSLLHLRRAVVVLQCRWRLKAAVRLSQIEASQYKSATMIQKLWRDFQQRSYLAQVAATKIQALWRSFWTQLQYQIDLMDIITVQCRTRTWIAKQELLRRSNAIKVIQLAASKYAARKESARLKVQSTLDIAAVNCQRNVRRLIAMKRTRLKLRAALRLQTVWRMSLARVRVREHRAMCRSEKLSVQSWAAARLQSTWRMHMAKASSQALRIQCRAATSLQSIWRMHAAKTSCQVLAMRLQGVVRLQSVCRMYLAKASLCELQAQNQGVVRLQSAFRMYLARAQRHNSLRASIYLQANARRMLARLYFRLVQRSAIAIQSFWRSKVSRMKYAICVRQVVVVQSYVRGTAAVTEATQRRSAIVAIQGSTRRVLATRRVCTIRQTLHTQTRAALLIQSKWRCFCAFVKFRLVVTDVVTLQTAFRRTLVQMKQHKRFDAIIKIQQSARSWVARQKLYQLLNARDRRLQQDLTAAKCIQSTFRGHLVRREISVLMRSATIIQRIFRGFFCRINYRMDLIDIIISQNAARRWIARRTVAIRHASVVRLQSVARMKLARRKSTALHMTKNKIEYEYLAARRIQKTWRCYTVHVDYMLSILAAILMQTCIRRHIGQLTAKKRLRAVLCLQSFGRHAVEQIRASKAKRAVVVLQSFARMSFAWSMFHLERTAAVMLQRCVRGFLARLDLSIQQFAACEIQRAWRGYDGYVTFACTVLSVIKIQSASRMLSAQLKLEIRRTEAVVCRLLRTRSARLVQCAFRDFMLRLRKDIAIRILQRASKVYLSKTTFTKLRRGTIRMQSIIRGQHVRRSRPKKLVVHVRRIQRANTRARADPKLRLGYRTRTALNILQKSTRLAEIMAAICTLEIATRLSQVCCESFAEADAPNILFSLIRTCNRSLPHVELLHHILLTMSNVAQYDDLLPSMATVTGVEVFLDLVQMFRDKDVVFCLAISLLERVVQCSEDFQILCSSRENLKRLKGVHALCVRKLSISHAGGRASVGRESMLRPIKADKVRMTRRGTNLRQGVRTLHRIINLVDSGQI